MKLLLILLTLLTLPVMAQPNLLVIWIDDLGTQRLDYPEAKMPNLDALAVAGATFTQAHAASPLCSPSRGAVLSGLPVHVSGHGGNVRREVFRNIDAFANVTTWPQDLRENHGYTTYTAGKIFHGGEDALSFDHFGPRLGGKDKRGPVVFRPATGVRVSYSNQHPDATKDGKTAAWAVDVLEQPHTNPFALFVGIRRPHGPHHQPAAYNQWELGDIGIPSGYLADDRDDTFGPFGLLEAKMKTDRRRGRWPEIIRGYLASAYGADYQAGRVLDALKASPYADNTVVVAMGDHGYCLGEKDHVTKLVMWDCGNRTELTIAGPGVPAGQTVTDIVSLMDVQPTVLELMGLPPRDDIAGQSLMPAINGAAFEGWSIATSGKKNHALRARGHTYIRYQGGQEELYDLASDPHEHHNMLDQAGVPAGYAMMSDGLDALLSGAERPF